MAKKTLSTEITESTLEDFTSHTTERGYVKYRAIEAAFRAFMALPPDTQAALMNENLPPKDVALVIAKGLVSAEVVAYFDPLSPGERVQFLEDVKKTRQKFRRKK